MYDRAKTHVRMVGRDLEYFYWDGTLSRICAEPFSFCFSDGWVDTIY